ncbi:2,3-butanediol dehydrogenase [Gordonia rhizosphera]|uniref:Putative 2,3-butanediol dehydrogenase n=1 Tax=Gordonia rhizosphera NBRC 16068 TaxID=1108045 RepID=K6WGQ4_9ACTN|nr:2,3-butanediol dehydrogenase [Gordonia rhizosphera]GAB92956.1 putative 2,3-butanediol dehydrogenase [Gordonia rhizosphera NBRC 16068]
MRAARYYDRGDIRIEDITEPEVVPGTVGIDVAWCGICGTDLHEYAEGPIFIPPAGHPQPISKESAPITLGHEMSGVVYAVGAGLDDIAVGDHVVVEPYILHDDVDTGPDSHDYHLSEDMNFIGLGGCGGGLGEKITVKRRWVHKISSNIPLDQAALIEPLSVGYHAVERSGAASGATALITGAGPIGLLTAAVCKAKGITTIISEPSSLRRNKAVEAGVGDHIVDPVADDVVARVRDINGGRGADVGFECTSVQPALDTLLDALKPTGVLVVVSIWSHPGSVDMQKLVLKEIDMRGTIAYVNSHPATIELVEQGKVDLAPFITGRIGLDHLIDAGFDTLINRNETAVKILVSPSGAGL